MLTDYIHAGYLVLGLDYFQNVSQSIDVVLKSCLSCTGSDLPPQGRAEGEQTWVRLRHMESREDRFRRHKSARMDGSGQAAVWKSRDEICLRRVCSSAQIFTLLFAKRLRYCFGAPYVCNSLADGTCAVGGFAHPAFLKEHHFQNLKAPLFLSCAETDHTFGTESRNQAIDILIEGTKDYQLQLFHGVAHGFALRANLNVPYEREYLEGVNRNETDRLAGWVKEQSLKGLVDYFDFWLSQ